MMGITEYFSLFTFDIKELTLIITGGISDSLKVASRSNQNENNDFYMKQINSWLLALTIKCF